MKERQKREDVRDEGEQRGRVERWKNKRKNVTKIDNRIIREGKDDRWKKTEIGKKQLRNKDGKRRNCAFSQEEWLKGTRGKGNENEMK